MDKADVILGQDLIRWAKYTNLIDDFASILDPSGYNVVASEVFSESIPELHLNMLFKLVNQEEPVEGDLIIPYVIYKQIKHRVEIGEMHVH